MQTTSREMFTDLTEQELACLGGKLCRAFHQAPSYDMQDTLFVAAEDVNRELAIRQQ